MKIKSLLGKMPQDLSIIILLTLLTAFVILIRFNLAPLRIVLGLLFLFLLSGYALITALFPGKKDLDWIERVALSLGFSIVIASLIGLLLNYTPWGIKVNSVLISLSFFIISMSVVTAFRCINLPVHERYFVNFSSIKAQFTDFFSAGSVVVKTIAIISFLLIIPALILIKNNPATGYELSIYASTPVLVWIFLVGSIIGGIGIITYQTFIGDERSNWWIIGFFILILNNFIILSMHAFKDYLHYAGCDHMCHLRWIKNLVDSGHFKSDNFYPIIHIFSSQISVICNIPPDIVVKYLPAFFSTLFLMLFMYPLAKSTLLEKGQVLLACAASCILFFNTFHVQVYPHVLSVLLYPLILYLYFKGIEKPSLQFKLLFIVLLILLPYTHPSGSLAMIFLLTALELSRIAYDKRYDPRGSLSRIAINPILISFITFFTWMSSFRVFGVEISELYSSIFEPYKAPHFVKLVEVTARLEWVEVIEYNVKTFGDNLIYIILALIAGAIVIKRILKKEKGTKYLFLLFILLLICIPIEYFFFIGVGGETAGRLLHLNYMMVVTPVLVRFVLRKLFKNKKRALTITAVVIILALTSGISIFSVYHSPWIFSASWHITNMDVKGSDWFLAHRNSSLEFDAMGVDPSLLLGKIGLMPAHFNYSYHETLGESLARDSYAVINKRCKLANADPMIVKTRLGMRSGWGFNEDDFKKLENDSSVAKLYSNGEFDTFLVHSSNMQEVRER